LVKITIDNSEVKRMLDDVMTECSQWQYYVIDQIAVKYEWGPT